MVWHPHRERDGKWTCIKFTAYIDYRILVVSSATLHDDGLSGRTSDSCWH